MRSRGILSTTILIQIIVVVTILPKSIWAQSEETNPIQTKILELLGNEIISGIIVSVIAGLIILGIVGLVKRRGNKKIVKINPNKNSHNEEIKSIQMLQVIPIINKIFADSEKYREKIQKPSTHKTENLLFVVNIQKDFCSPDSRYSSHLYVKGTKELIPSLNNLIKTAEKNDFEIIYTKDWHPKDHDSFDVSKDSWITHCVANKEGADFHKDLYRKEKPHIVHIGTTNDTRDYTPFEDKKLIEIINKIKPRRIWIAGIALEYCVLATALDSLGYAEHVTILEKYILAADPKSTYIEEIWDKLEEKNIRKMKTDDEIFELFKK